MSILYLFTVYHSSGWISSWLPSWCPTLLSHLIKAEDRIPKRKCTVRVTPIRESSPDLSASGVQRHQVPLVLLHGFGGGVGLWVKNLPALAQEGRAFFALDMLGFGRSSRPTFGRDDMCLLPILKHLVLVEPWGFAARPDVKERWVPIWIKIFGAAMNPFNPLGPLRLAGPLGPLLLQLLRADFKQKYASVFEDDTVSDYIYHVNAQMASGETAFKNMTVPYAWPQHPMMDRVEMISPMSSHDLHLRITKFYFSDHIVFPFKTPHNHLFLSNSFKVIQGAGHYIFADQSEDFNQAVLKICNNFRHIINGEEYNQ
uniref:1-acylglycerol-3-phosphate O-acyltransferase ABHD5 n=1 Tax=Sinocyclocheilus anshuiensis TaxID=1608454 RepID=A0A671MKP3_9TELE